MYVFGGKESNGTNFNLLLSSICTYKWSFVSFSQLFTTFVASELAPWFHAVHHTHYARWIPVHLKGMAELATKHPDVARKFREGHFTVHKT